MKVHLRADWWRQTSNCHAGSGGGRDVEEEKAVVDVDGVVDDEKKMGKKMKKKGITDLLGLCFVFLLRLLLRKSSLLLLAVVVVVVAVFYYQCYYHYHQCSYP